jgi:hypothetical protein
VPTIWLLIYLALLNSTFSALLHNLLAKQVQPHKLCF